MLKGQKSTCAMGCLVSCTSDECMSWDDWQPIKATCSAALKAEASVSIPASCISAMAHAMLLNATIEADLMQSTVSSSNGSNSNGSKSSSMSSSSSSHGREVHS